MLESREGDRVAASTRSARGPTAAKDVLTALVAVCIVHGLLGVLSFGYQAFRADPLQNDVPNHVLITLEAARGEREWPAYTVYNRLLYVLAGFEPDAGRLKVASVAILALAMVARAFLTVWSLRGALHQKRALILTALALTLAMPIFNWWDFPDVYLGQITPTIWHNPTTVLALPLALWLFLAHLRAREDLGLRSATLVGLAMALNVAVKPNYLLAFAPVVAIDLLWRGVRGSWRSVLPIGIVYFGPLALALSYQYLATFSVAEGGIAIRPFQVWRMYSPNLPASLLLSTAFPLVVAGALTHERSWNAELTLSWGSFGLAMAQMSLLVEASYRDYHANFMWGCHITLFVLFVVSARSVVTLADRRWRNAALIVLGLHALAGIVFYLRSFRSTLVHGA